LIECWKEMEAPSASIFRLKIENQSQRRFGFEELERRLEVADIPPKQSLDGGAPRTFPFLNIRA